MLTICLFPNAPWPPKPAAEAEAEAAKYYHLQQARKVWDGWIWMDGWDGINGQGGRAWAELSSGCTVSMSSARISAVGQVR